MSAPSPASPLIYVKLALMALFWAAAFVIGRRVVLHLEPFSAAAVRFVFSTLFLSALILALRGKIPSVSLRQLPVLALLGMTGVFAYNVFFFEGLKTITAAKAALILAANPVVIALVAALFFHEKPSPRQAVGVVASLTGVVAVIADGNPLALLANGIGAGETAMLCSMTAWCAYSLIGKRVLKNISPLRATCVANAFGAAALLVSASAAEDVSEIARLPAEMWAALLFLGVISSGVANTWYYQGIAQVGAARAANFINLVPVFAAIMGWLFLNETLSPAQLLGGAMVVAGVAMVNRA